MKEIAFTKSANTSEKFDAKLFYYEILSGDLQVSKNSKKSSGKWLNCEQADIMRSENMFIFAIWIEALITACKLQFEMVDIRSPTCCDVREKSF